ncbi:MAG: glutamine synthetase III [Bacteriovoracaceae bacterium]|nr:glutamine synthetase III [Bacteriovoracaceae bacterium]
MSITTRNQAKLLAASRTPQMCNIPTNPQGKFLPVSQYYGENVFDFRLSKNLSQSEKNELQEIQEHKITLSEKLAKSYAHAVLEWALEKGATHFCHWFQPLTGSTAEKHDAFLSFEKNNPVEKLSASQLMQGEPDASSFPNGGSRSTFEARGYTSWDLTSPIFIKENENGRTLFIPTAFVSYHGEALDIKTPLLRSITKLSETASEFCRITGSSNVKRVNTTCGCEQEYFLIDKAFYHQRSDLVMTGRSLFGSLSAKNQQLEDHYFGSIPARVLSFMQEVEIELYRLGIPAKTRHNEVAPGQFEIAPIFEEANIAADHNQLVMTTIREVAIKHDFVAILHEKPFAGINGSGKHVNWSMSDDEGKNLLEPGTNPHENYRFLALVGVVCEALFRHADTIRMGIATHGNDHRLGANEAPPSIISVFLGETLTNIMESLISNAAYKPNGKIVLDLGANQLAQLLKDTTDRNRTSPFAFTGNKFEFRAVGSSAAVGWPVSILNAAIDDILGETNTLIKEYIASGKTIDESLIMIAQKWYKNARNVVFGGDGYSEEWVKEAKSRGLNNFRTMPEAIAVLKDESKTKFLTTSNVYHQSELKTRYNVLLERYITHRKIEFQVLSEMIRKNVLPSAIRYKQQLAQIILEQKEIGFESVVEKTYLKDLNILTENLYTSVNNLESALEAAKAAGHEKTAFKIAQEVMPLSVAAANLCNEIEDLVPESHWDLPTYFDMLFIR